MSSTSSATSLGIAGVGVLGCSIALRYREAFPAHAVIGLDGNESHLAIARERGAITGTASDLADLARRVEILVLAVPIGSLLKMLQTLIALELGDTGPDLILDVASVKAVVVDAGAQVPHFIGTHPLAGSEMSGPTAARADLFVGRTWTYVPGEDAGTVAAAKAFILAMGAHAVALDAVTHDTMVARTSHLPQTLSTVLAVRALREPVQGVYGQGLLDMLRLARSTDAVWSDIYVTNAHAIAAELEAYADQLREVANAVKLGDRHALRDLFEHANQLCAAGLLESPFVG